MNEDLVYIVYDREGRAVLAATASCRYPKEIEQSLMAAGYTIKLYGKRITKKEVNAK